jgi:hypothetical protein
MGYEGSGQNFSAILAVPYLLHKTQFEVSS